MKKKYRNISALCLTALLVCLLPVNTMLAAAESTDLVQDTSSGAAVVAEQQEETAAENTASEKSGADTEDQDVSDTAEETESGAEESDIDVEEDQEAQEAESGTEGEQEAEPATEKSQETDAAEKTGFDLVSGNDTVSQSQVHVFSDNSVMEDNGSEAMIKITLQGEDVTRQLGGSIDIVKYLNNHDQRFEISGSGLNGGTVGYYLSCDEESMDEAQLAGKWSAVLSNNNISIPLGSEDGKFVLYVKVEVGGQSYCARSGGVVVDTVKPVITGVSHGGTYKAGTTFTVQDANLDTVTINNEIATPSDDGSYRIKTGENSTSCVIKATDKANHETTVSITVVDGDDDDDNKDDNNKDDDNDTTVISESRAYTLKAGTAYKLGSGKWTLSGDSAVYQGGITFYVAADGEYTFNKRK